MPIREMNGAAEELRGGGMAICGAATVFGDVGYASLLLQANNFASDPLVCEEIRKHDAGENRDTRKQFLIKYREDARKVVHDDLGDTGLFRLLPLIKSYLGDDLCYYSSDFWYVIPSGTRPREWSQNWHRDPESSTVVKAICFFSDVE